MPHHNHLTAHAYMECNNLYTKEAHTTQRSIMQKFIANIAMQQHDHCYNHAKKNNNAQTRIIMHKRTITHQKWSHTTNDHAQLKIMHNDHAQQSCTTKDQAQQSHTKMHQSTQ